MSDGNSCTTNNRMELTAIIEAISSIKPGLECKIYTDSQLCINCATGKWKRKANLDLWKEYNKFCKNKIINFEWVKAHNGNKYNEIVDNLAYTEAKLV
jgi:ribonuclease HI